MLARHQRRSRSLVVLLILVATTLTVVDRTGDVAPIHLVRSEVRDTSGVVGNSIGSVWPFRLSERVAALQRDNDRLRTQLADAQGELSRSTDVERQRDALLQLTDLSTPDSVPKVVAGVTAADTSNFDATVELGKGSDSGIAVGMPVATGLGLVGSVVETSKTQATVRLLTDSTSDVGVRIGPTGEIGVGAGQGRGQSLRVDLIDLSSPIAVGDVAVTSGEQHGLYPPGLVVGTVQSSATSRGALRRDVRLKPAVGVGTLSEVAVLKWKPSP